MRSGVSAGMLGGWPAFPALERAVIHLERSSLFWLVLAVSAVPMMALGRVRLDELFRIGGDYNVVMDATHRWLAGGPFYEPWQLTGPYTRLDMPVLYPPTTLLLFVPASFLPPVLWWAIPLAVTVYAIIRLRPRRWTWPAMLLMLGTANAFPLIMVGNPVIWTMAALAAGTIWRWPEVFVLLKPSLFPFSLGGIRARGWWVGIGLFAVTSLLLLPLWGDYLAAMRNWTDTGLAYSGLDVPLMLIPVFAWLGRRQRSEATWSAD